MGIEKAEIKIGTAKTIGQQLAGISKGLSDELVRCEGGKRALVRARKTFDSVFKRVDEDLDEGALNDINEPMAVAKAIKKALVQALQGIEQLYDQEELARIQTGGRLDGLLKANEVVRKLAESEQQKINGIVEALEAEQNVAPSDTPPAEDSGVQQEPPKAPPGIVSEDSGQLPGMPPPTRPRPTGMRPAAGVAAARRAEQKAAESAKPEVAEQRASTKAAAKKAAKKAVPNDSESEGSLVNLGEALSQRQVRSKKKGSSRVLRSGGTSKKKTRRKDAPNS